MTLDCKVLESLVSTEPHMMMNPIKTLYMIFSVAVFDGGDVYLKFGMMGYVLG
jgi:hypothetical protein